MAGQETVETNVVLTFDMQARSEPYGVIELANGHVFPITRAEGKPLRFDPETQEVVIKLTEHDKFILRDAFEGQGFDTSDVVIDELREGTFFAKIRYEIGGESGQLDARPSDAVAIGVRVGSPIFVAVSVLEEAGIPTEDDDENSAVEASESEAERPTKAEPKSDLEKKEELLKAAITKEDYEKAAQLRDEINKLKGRQN